VCLYACLKTDYKCVQPMYPGQTHRIRRNLLNFVLAVDLGTPDGLAAAAAAQTLFQQQLPIRWGVLPLNTSLRIGERVQRVPACVKIAQKTCSLPASNEQLGTHLSRRLHCIWQTVQAAAHTEITAVCSTV